MVVTICCQKATNCACVRGVGGPGVPVPVELPTERRMELRLVVGHEVLGDRRRSRRCSPLPRRRRARSPSWAASGWRRSWSSPMPLHLAASFDALDSMVDQESRRGSPWRTTVAAPWSFRASSRRWCSRSRCRCRAAGGSTRPKRRRSRRSRREARRPARKPTRRPTRGGSGAEGAVGASGCGGPCERRRVRKAGFAGRWCPRVPPPATRSCIVRWRLTE